MPKFRYNVRSILTEKLAKVKLKGLISHLFEPAPFRIVIPTAVEESLKLRICNNGV